MSVHELPREPDVEQMAAEDMTWVWEAAMGAAAKSFERGDHKTGVGKLAYAAWLAATHELSVSREKATALSTRINEAAGTFRPDGAA